MTHGALVGLAVALAVLLVIGWRAYRERVRAADPGGAPSGVPRRLEVDGVAVVVTYDEGVPLVEVYVERAVDPELAELVAPTPLGWTFSGQVYARRAPPIEAEAISDGVAHVRRLGLRAPRAASLLLELLERDPDPGRRARTFELFERLADLRPLRARARAVAQADAVPSIRLQAAMAAVDLEALEVLATAPLGPVALPAATALLALGPDSEPTRRALGGLVERRVLPPDGLAALALELGPVPLAWVEPLLVALAAHDDDTVATAASQALARRHAAAEPPAG